MPELVKMDAELDIIERKLKELEGRMNMTEGTVIWPTSIFTYILMVLGYLSNGSRLPRFIE